MKKLKMEEAYNLFCIKHKNGTDISKIAATSIVSEEIFCITLN